MKVQTVVIPSLILVIAWLAWSQFNMALENDGLRQNAKADRGSIEALLTYARVASRCDLKPEQLARAMGASTYASQADSTTRVAVLALQASFNERGPKELEIVNVGKVPVCSQ